MNIVDIIILVIVGCFVIFSAQKGFLSSSLKLMSFFLAWILAFLCYPLLSSSLAGTETYDTISFYTEGVEKIANFEDSRLLVDGLPESTLEEIMANTSVNEPFGTLIEANIRTQALKDTGATTVGEYFNLTMVNVIINLMAFALLLLALVLIFNFVINAVDAGIYLPSLKSYDSIVGGAVGIFRGIFIMFVPFSLVPVAIALMPLDIISELIEESTLSGLLMGSNFITGGISGII